jgi:nicotinate phosphoribosyltransferase
LRRGELVSEAPSLDAIRLRARNQLARLDEGLKRLDHPDQYPVVLERNLDELRSRLVREAGGVG